MKVAGQVAGPFTVKHANVTTAYLQVDRITDQMQVLIREEGIGFDPAQFLTGAGSTSGFGLFSVRERLDLLGGRMEIESVPGAGSRFTLLVPLVSMAAEGFHAGT